MRCCYQSITADCRKSITNHDPSYKTITILDITGPEVTIRLTNLTRLLLSLSFLSLLAYLRRLLSRGQRWSTDEKPRGPAVLWTFEKKQNKTI